MQSLILLMGLIVGQQPQVPVVVQINPSPAVPLIVQSTTFSAPQATVCTMGTCGSQAAVCTTGTCRQSTYAVANEPVLYKVKYKKVKAKACGSGACNSRAGAKACGSGAGFKLFRSCN